MKRRIQPALLILLGLTQAALAGDRVDFWHEEPQLFDSAPAGQPLFQRTDGKKKSKPAFTIDPTDKRNGDFSLCFNAVNAKNHTQAGFYCGPYQDHWAVDGNWSLHLFLKIASTDPSGLSFVLVDASNRKARLRPAGLKAGAAWQELTLPLNGFTADDGFDAAALRTVILEGKFTAKTRIWFDDVHFTNPTGSVVGVTDKSIDQRMAEAEANRPQRIRESYEYAAVKGVEMWYARFFARLYLGDDLDAVNRELKDVLASKDPAVRKEYGHDGYWDLAVNNTLIKIYYAFSDKGSHFPGRLYPDTQKALLDLLWERTYEKNDIAVARQSTWWMAGSENHDLSFKMSCYLSAQIFKNEPGFSDRIYPDSGHGAGTAYWFHRVDGKSFHGLDPRGDYKDGNAYTAEDHYEAWTTFFKEYITQRAQRGFFLERGSPTYMKYTASFLFSIYNFSEDAELKEKARAFLDLVMADWAQDQLIGARGGARTRVKASAYATNGSRDSYYPLSAFLLGGDVKDIATGPYSFVPLSDYRLPKVIWSMALDRESLGSYAYIARTPGEEENQWPRPLGLERSLLCDTHSRLVRYSWVTPDYILGTQMDHPGAVHSHLSCQARWQGISFSTNPDIKIFPRGIEELENGTWKMTTRFHRSVQDRNVLITQQNRHWTTVHPDWFPGKNQDSEPFGVYIGKGHDEVVEKGGWLFIRQGNAYVAIKVVLDQKIDPENPDDLEWYTESKALTAALDNDAYEWNPERTIIRFRDRFSPLILETARKADYPTFGAFQEDILDNPIQLSNTVVPEWYTFTYTGCGDDAQEIYFNAANSEIPMVGGKRIDYAYPMTFDSPYLKSEYNSGKIRIEYGGETLDLDFSNKPWWAFWR